MTRPLLAALGVVLAALLVGCPAAPEPPPLRAWSLPPDAAPGVYVARGDAVQFVAPVANVRIATRDGATVRYPDVLPSPVYVAEGGDTVIVAGATRAALADRVFTLGAPVGDPPWPLLGPAIGLPDACVEEPIGAVCAAAAFGPSTTVFAVDDRLAFVQIR